MLRTRDVGLSRYPRTVSGPGTYSIAAFRMPIERHVIKHVIKYRQRLYEIAVGLRIVIASCPNAFPVSNCLWDTLALQRFRVIE
jgi:hypothetical protein